VKRCHVCKEPLSREDLGLGYLVALRNGIYFSACFEHWFMWPDDHKSWPAVGYGRVPS
jgi:hypothetical protein